MLEHSNKPNPLSEKYECLLAAGTKPNLAKLTIARTITAIVLAMWKTQTVIDWRGGWNRDGAWVPVPFIDTHAAEVLFRSKVVAFLREEELLSDERIEWLYFWSHSGFSAHNSVTVQSENHDDMERLARCTFCTHP